MVKLKKINIPKDRNWTKIFRQLNLNNFHLIKYEDRWIASKIAIAGWTHSHHPDGAPENVYNRPHTWEFDYGSFYKPFESSGTPESMSEDITEIWEIDDPELTAKEAKRLLKK